jgi:hypothetical protein
MKLDKRTPPVLCALSLLLSSASARDLADRRTAKSNLPSVELKAKAWQPDARLWQVSAGSSIDFSGRIRSCDPKVPESGWTYFFWSPTAHTAYEVTDCNDQVLGEGLGGSDKKEDIGRDFIDTDRVGLIIKKLLKKYGCKSTATDWEGRLRFDPILDALASHLTWWVNCQCTVSTGLDATTDARSGKVLRSSVAEDEGED